MRFMTLSTWGWLPHTHVLVSRSTKLLTHFNSGPLDERCLSSSNAVRHTPLYHRHRRDGELYFIRLILCDLCCDDVIVAVLCFFVFIFIVLFFNFFVGGQL